MSENLIVEHQEIVDLAKNVVLNLPQAVERLPDFWQNLHAGSFVTAYKKVPPSSSNVWCCMSNGNYDDPSSIVDHIIESSFICSTRDPRVDKLVKPIAFEVCLLSPKKLWRDLGNGITAPERMKRDLQRAFQVTTINGSNAIYLPDVWNEFKHWSAEDLLTHLAQKAKSNILNITNVYEITCFVVADKEIPTSIHDRGFFPTLVLERAWNFYNDYRKDNKLAYLVKKDSTQYENKGAWVRSYGDVLAYHKLATLLNKDSGHVVEYALKNFERNDAASMSAYLQLQYETQNTIEVDDVETLLQLANESTEFGFEKPQSIIALCTAYEYFNTRNDLALRQQIEQCVRDYFQSYQEIEAAFTQHGAFAANWFLQATAKVSKTSWSCLSAACANFKRINKSILFATAVNLCQNALRNKESITEEACAAHGLLATSLFDFVANDSMVERWAQLQYEWKMNGGFRYKVGDNWYRTDVTSHVVEVCFLLRN